MDKLLAMVLRKGNGYTVWYPDIPADEPLLVKLLEKYRDDGISVYGTQTDVIDDLRDTFDLGA